MNGAMYAFIVWILWSMDWSHATIDDALPNDVQEIVNRAAANDAAVTAIDCRFLVSVGTVDNDRDFSVHQLSRTRGTARGRWLVHEQDELYELSIGDVFQTTMVTNDVGERTLSLPFPGGQFVLKNSDFVISISTLLGGGQIGRRDTFFAEELYHPRQCMGAIGSDQYANPHFWYVEPPLPMSSKVEALPHGVSIISDFVDGAELTSEFDPRANWLLTASKLSSGNSYGEYRVLSWVTLANGSTIPKKCYAIFASNGAYPLTMAYWELTNLNQTVDPTEIAIAIDQRYQVRVGNAMSNTHLHVGTRLKSNQLEDVFFAAIDDRDLLLESHDASTVISHGSPSSQTLGFLWCLVPCVFIIIVACLCKNRLNGLVKRT